MSYQWLEIDGARIAYQAQGEPDRPALVLLHGYPTSAMLWEPVVPQALAAGARVIAPDLPGFGQSDLWRRPADHASYVAFLDRFFPALGLTRFHLGVHDWGGPIGLAWAIAHPDAIASLFITDTAFFPDFTWEFGEAMREPGRGEHLVERLQAWETFAPGMQRISPNASEATLRSWHGAFSSLERCHPTWNCIARLMRLRIPRGGCEHTGARMWEPVPRRPKPWPRWACRRRWSGAARMALCRRSGLSAFSATSPTQRFTSSRARATSYSKTPRRRLAVCWRSIWRAAAQAIKIAPGGVPPPSPSTGTSPPAWAHRCQQV